MENQTDTTGERGPTPICRRALLERAIGAAAAATLTGMAVPAGIYLWPMRREAPDGGLVPAGRADDLPVGEARLVKLRDAPVILVRTSQEETRALSAVCTHLGCLVEWRKGQQDLYCPCHGGRFDLDGKVIGGPPPRPLPRYAVTIADGELQVSTKPS